VKNKGMLLALAMVLTLVLGFSGLANAVSLSFQATDPTDTTNPDFDIIAFGATPNGNKIDLWIQVRGNINTEPKEGYMNTYVMDIYGSNNDYEAAVFWINYQGNTQTVAWFKAGDNTNYLSSGDYTVSGNKLTFHIDSALIGDVGNEYQVIVTTVHTESSSPSLSDLHTDQAEYDYNSQSRGTSNGGNQGETSSEEVTALAILSGIGAIACTVIWFIIWILIALWAYKDAKKKCNEHPGLWFLVVFFLNIIGIIIYVIVVKDECNKQQVYVPPPPS